MSRDERETEDIRGVLIDVLDWKIATERIERWASERAVKYVAICNVHSIVTAGDDPRLLRALNGADMATPDGMPLAWLLSRRLNRSHQRINGPDLTLRLCALAEKKGIRVAFYGGSTDTVERLRHALEKHFPQLQVVLIMSPPTIPLNMIEQDSGGEAIKSSGAQICFVGLGCPKQEIWMEAHVRASGCVLIGVGAAFDYIAGTVRRPPLWMQHMGLEWAGRLLAEPRRLWRRYLYTNSVFVVYVLKDLFGFSSRR